jgi:hypothetical protein
MKIIRLFTGSDKKSHFEEIKITNYHHYPFGKISEPVAVKQLFFRTTSGKENLSWHNAPTPQYIVYLEGEVEIEIDNGEKQHFFPGDILLVEDTTGKGHISRALSAGSSLVITLDKSG